MLDADGTTAAPGAVLRATVLALLGIVPLAAAIAGQLFRPLGPAGRAVLLVAAAILLIPHTVWTLGVGGLSALDLIGIGLLAGVAFTNWRQL